MSHMKDRLLSNDRISICNRCSLLERAHSFPSIRLDVITLPLAGDCWLSSKDFAPFLLFFRKHPKSITISRSQSKSFPTNRVSLRCLTCTRMGAPFDRHYATDCIKNSVSICVGLLERCSVEMILIWILSSG